MRKLVAVAALGALALTGTACSSMNQRDITCTVINKEAVNMGDGGNQYRVYTEDCGTLAVEDSITQTRFDSADVYAKIEPGKRYEFHVGGYRVGILSSFPNILSYKEVAQ